MGVYESFIVRSIGTGYPEVEQSDSSVRHRVVELRLVQGVVVPHAQSVFVAAGVGGLAFDQDYLAANVDAGIVVIAEFRCRDTESRIDDVCGDVAVAGHSAGEPAVSPGVGLGDPYGVLAFLAVDREEDVHGASWENFNAGVGVFLNISAVVTCRFKPPFLEVVLDNGYCFCHSGRAGKASLKSGVGELFDISEKFV